MTLAPNVMWYHHYTFLILPLFIWMGYAKLAPHVVGWCLLGMLIIQVDRWALTHGLLIHVFAHLPFIHFMDEIVDIFLRMNAQLAYII